MIITAGISFYCTKEEPREEFCNCKNPINDLPWLRNMVKQYKKTPGLYRCISQCTYNDGIEGFYLEPCVSGVEFCAYLYNCRGEELDKVQHGSEYHAFIAKWNIDNREIIWINYK